MRWARDEPSQQAAAVLEGEFARCRKNGNAKCKWPDHDKEEPACSCLVLYLGMYSTRRDR